jgi:hypothetical protein
VSCLAVRFPQPFFNSPLPFKMRLVGLSRRIYLREGNLCVAPARPIPKTILLESFRPSYAAVSVGQALLPVRFCWDEIPLDRREYLSDKVK